MEKSLKKFFLFALAGGLLAPLLATAAAPGNPYQPGSREYKWYEYRYQQKLKKEQGNTGRDASGVYKKYEAQPQKTPVPKTAKAQGTTVSFHKPSWAVALKGGLGLPLGESADVTEGGFASSLDVYFRATPVLSMDLFGHYLAAPYKNKDAGDPMALVGGGFRALYHPFKMEKMLPHLGAGLGYMSANRATARPVLDPVTGNPMKDFKGDIINDVVYESSGGIVFTGAVGATYEIVPRVGLQVELSIYSISLQGGTSDSLLTAQAGMGIQYSF